MQVFTFDAANGLVAGFHYIIRARAHNFISDYFSLQSTWSATASFYSTNLPETVATAPAASTPPTTGLRYSGLSKTDVTIEWDLLSSDKAKGYPIEPPKYTL
jgi:hypothetical protein